MGILPYIQGRHIGVGIQITVVGEMATTLKYNGRSESRTVDTWLKHTNKVHIEYRQNSNRASEVCG